jgi:predicted dehydrogenase
MTKIQIAIVGCGGMGMRHLCGLQELAGSPLNNVELVAACDLRLDNAELLADKAAELLGHRPQVFGDMADMVAAWPELRGVDIATDAGTHHVVAQLAFELGLNVLCEKPLGITVRASNLILEAQGKAGKVLSVAENYRRDPMSRLTKNLIEVGAIGQPTMLFDVNASGSNNIIILPWRHDLYRGGIVLDAGVHNADMMQFYLGDVREVSAVTAMWEKTRFKPKTGAGPGGFYAHWYETMPESITPTAEDTLIASLRFAGGALGQWTQCYAAHGRGFGQHMLYGSQGALKPGGTRNGASPVLYLDDGGEVTGDDLLTLVPDYYLDAITADLFGVDRPASYNEPFQVADRRLLAIEYHEFADCVLRGAMPEVDGVSGRRALAVCYAALESGAANRPVTVDEVVSEQVRAYAAPIDAHWGI